jgi:hypothetical protein
MSVPSEVWGLVGVVLGWGLTAVSSAIRRHAGRKDRARELAVRRGEELVEQCHKAFQWMEDTKRAAFDVSPGQMRVQRPVMRAVAIVEMYYPSLGARARAADAAATTFRNAAIAVVTARAGYPIVISKDLAQKLEGPGRELMTAIGLLLSDARDVVRAQIGK